MTPSKWKLPKSFVLTYIVHNLNPEEYVFRLYLFSFQLSNPTIWIKAPITKIDLFKKVIFIPNWHLIGTITLMYILASPGKKLRPLCHLHIWQKPKEFAFYQHWIFPLYTAKSKMSHSIHMLSIQIDTKSLEQHQIVLFCNVFFHYVFYGY